MGQQVWYRHTSKEREKNGGKKDQKAIIRNKNWKNIQASQKNGKISKRTRKKIIFNCEKNKRYTMHWRHKCQLLKKKLRKVKSKQNSRKDIHGNIKLKVTNRGFLKVSYTERHRYELSSSDSGAACTNCCCCCWGSCWSIEAFLAVWAACQRKATHTV